MTLALSEIPSGPVQLLNEIAVIVPSGLFSPLPLLSVAFADDDVHVSVVPVVESERSVAVAVPVTAPPGETVQVVVAAQAGLVARLVTAAVAAATQSSLLPRRMCIGMRFSLL